MKRKTLIIVACLVIVVLSFLAQPAYATSITQDPVAFIIELIEALIRFLVWLIESFLAFLAQLFGA